MSAQAAKHEARPRFRPGQAAVLKRSTLGVTVRQRVNLAEADIIDGEARPYMVTVDEGACAGLKLWAAERELVERTL